jgi:multidrug efflux pump
MIKPTDGNSDSEGGSPDGAPDSEDRAQVGPGYEPGFLARFKEFRATSVAVDHQTSVLVLFAFITVAGLFAYGAIPRESFPEIEIPMIAVNTIYPGVTPADIESLITRPLEDELSTLSDVKELTSTSVEGYSSIVAEFGATVDLEGALQGVREKVDLAKAELPTEAEDPSIIEFDFSEMPIMQVNLSGQYGLVRLKELGEEMQDRIEQIPGVLRVDVRGGLEREVKVDVHLNRLQFYGLEIPDVIEAIRDENVNIPGGSIDVGPLQYLVRVAGEFDDPMIIQDLVVATEDGRPIYVRDIADVDFGFRERTNYARLDDAPVVTLDVVKRSGENIIETAELVKAAIREMEPLLPPTTVVKITSDQSVQIDEMVSSLENNIISGLILIIGVLLFFLGAANSVFVAISIPTSMLLSFVILKLLGITLNMVVLFSLILALGMLVDNAIVVVENIYRYVEEGWDRRTAAKKATGEVAMPVIAATATTLAAFTPLLFWPGQVGEFMEFMPLTLIIALSSSLFVALVIVPTLCAMFLRLEDDPAPPLRPAARWTMIGTIVLAGIGIGIRNPLMVVLMATTVVGLYALHSTLLRGMAVRFQRVWLPGILTSYERQLRWALDHRAYLLAGSFLGFLAVGGLFSQFNAGVEFFPEDMPPRQILVDMDLPVGSSPEATDAIALRLEADIQSLPGTSEVESVVATVGGSGSGGNPMGGGASGPNTGRVTVSMIDFGSQNLDAKYLLAAMQAALGRDIAGADIKVEQPADGPAQGRPVNIEIVGEDPATLQDLSDRVLAILESDPVYGKLVGLESDLDAARPELSVSVDREKAALYGVSSRDVGTAIRGAIQGTEAGKYRTGNNEYDIVVRLAEEYRGELESLRDLTVMNEGTQIPLLSVAKWEVREGYGSIRRKDQTRMATISSDVRASLNNNSVLGEVQSVLADFAANELPVGYGLQYTGQSEEQAEAQEFLQTAFLGAIMLIGLILVSQFNSVVTPLIILTSVFMSTGSVLLGLLVFRMPFSIIMTGVGVISLAGIVVNNAIVLLDYVGILRTRDGLSCREALVRGGAVRFRPVVLTAVTTALGLIPLAVGLNFDFFGLYTRLEPELYWGGEQAVWWGPMAIAVIIGILFATFLTLILVPVLYSVVDDASDVFRRNFTQGGVVSAEQGALGTTSGETWSPEPEGTIGPDSAEPSGGPTEGAPVARPSGLVPQPEYE